MRDVVFGLLMLITLQANGQQLTVREIRDPDTNFGQYQTYHWASQVFEVLDEDHYFLNDLILKADLRNAVRNELKERGYLVDRANPDLIVNMRIFEKSAVLRGFEGYGKNYWQADEYSPVTDNNYVEVDAGTVIISLLDRDQGKVVWQGFVSGLMESGSFLKNEDMIRKAVELLMGQYGVRVSEYTRR